MSVKKKISLIAVILIITATVVTGTIAYFSDDITAHNVITSGEIDIDLEETTEDGEPWPEGGISNVMPGIPVTKNVRIINNGADAWVRIHIEVKVTDELDNPLPITLSNGDSVIQMVFPDDFTQYWAEEDDGYFYYKTPVGVSTSFLITAVILNPALPNEYQGCKCDVIVTAQAVQYKKNGDDVGQTYKDARGWPKDQPQ